MTPRTLEVRGVELCAETFGDPADPAVLLIAGAAMSMDWWRPAFCEQLAATGRLVIRYDHRDTGASTSSPAGAPDYTGLDLCDDAIGLLDALGVGRAHLAGISMGGGIAQWLALEHPDRVASLTLMSTSPAGSGADDLPPPAERMQAAFADPPPEPDWTDREAAIEYLLAGERSFAGSLERDEAEQRALAGTIVDRTRDLAAATKNHWILEGGETVRDRLGEIRAPTLVLHGTEDPVFPIAHGEALAREIPGARFVALEGVGHEVPPAPTWDLVVAEIAAVSA